MKTLVAIAALCLSAGAQTVAIPGMLVTIPARAVPSQTLTIDVPKNGGKMSITIPSQILPPQVSSTAPRTAPVSLGNITINFTCTGADMQHLSCQAVQQVAQVVPNIFIPATPPRSTQSYDGCNTTTYNSYGEATSTTLAYCPPKSFGIPQGEVQQWGDWPPDQHVSKPGAATVQNCDDPLGEGFNCQRINTKKHKKEKVQQ